MWIVSSSRGHSLYGYDARTAYCERVYNALSIITANYSTGVFQGLRAPLLASYNSALENNVGR